MYVYYYYYRLSTYLALSLDLPYYFSYPNPDSDDAPSLFLYICSFLVIVVEYTSVGKRPLFFSCGSWLLITHTDISFLYL